MLCVSQQADPVLKSIKPNYKKPAENWWLYCTLCQFSHHRRKSPQKRDVGHQRMPARTAADR